MSHDHTISESGSLSPRLAHLIVFLALAGIGATAFVDIIELRAGAARTAACALILLALLGLQVFQVGYRPRRRNSGFAAAVLALQFLLTFAPFTLFGEVWPSIPGFFAGNALFALRRPLRYAAFAAAVLGVGLVELQVSQQDAATEAFCAMVTAATTGFVVYGLCRLAGPVAHAEHSRAELTRRVLAQERLRFARDLHDLLGYNLSGIALKSELARGLAVEQPARAIEQLDDIIGLSRQALSDVRTVTGEGRDMSVADVLVSARSVLAAAGIDAAVEEAHGPLPERAGTVLALLVREGVTNVLRHSAAEHCRITIRQRPGGIGLTIVNDGVTPATDRGGAAATDRRATAASGHGGAATDRATAETDRGGAARAGTGLASLSDRVAALGGRLTAGVGADGRFRLAADIPLAAGDRPPGPLARLRAARARRGFWPADE